VTSLFDSSVLVAGLVESHPMHAAAFARLERVHAGKLRGLVAAHGLAETFAVLTTLPHRPRITPAAARDVLRVSVLSRFRIVSLAARDYQAVIDAVAGAGLSGGIL
jgi:predicted nucleic acid-binding protein